MIVKIISYSLWSLVLFLLITLLYNIFYPGILLKFDLFSSLIGSLVGLATLELAKAAEKTSLQSLEISERMEDFEYKSESPALFIVPDKANGSRETLHIVNSSTNEKLRVKFRIENVGSSAAVNVFIEGLVNHDYISYIPPGTLLPSDTNSFILDLEIPIGEMYDIELGYDNPNDTMSYTTRVPVERVDSATLKIRGTSIKYKRKVTKRGGLGR